MSQNCFLTSLPKGRDNHHSQTTKCRVRDLGHWSGSAEIRIITLILPVSSRTVITVASTFISHALQRSWDRVTAP